MTVPNPFQPGQRITVDYLRQLENCCDNESPPLGDLNRSSDRQTVGPFGGNLDAQGQHQNYGMKTFQAAETFGHASTCGIRDEKPSGQACEVILSCCTSGSPNQMIASNNCRRVWGCKDQTIRKGDRFEAYWNGQARRWCAICNVGCCGDSVEIEQVPAEAPEVEIDPCNECDCCPEGDTPSSITLRITRLTCCPNAVGTFILLPSADDPAIYCSDDFDCQEDPSVDPI